MKPAVNPLLALAFTTLAACGAEEVSPAEAQNNPGAAAESTGMPCGPENYTELPMEVLTGAVRFRLKGVYYENGSRQPEDYDVELGPSDAGSFTYCDAPDNLGDATFQFAVTPRGPVVSGGNRAEISFGPMEFTDFTATGENGESFFQSRGMILGFSGPQDEEEGFTLTASGQTW
jgi:hypothetical protein